MLFGAAPGATKDMSARTHPVHRGYADTKAGQIHYREVAGRAPAIVFLHQTASSSASFQVVMERLKLPNRLIAIDTPGFGASFDPPGSPTLARYADYMLAALDELHVKRFHVFGQHTGANIAAAMALRAPARICSVMMLGPAQLSPSERRSFRGAFSEPIRPRADGAHLLQNWSYAADNNPGCSPELLHGEVVSMLRAWRGRGQAYRAVSFDDTGGSIRKIRAPLLFMSAPGDYFFPRFAEVCALRPDAVVAMVGGDNFPPLRDPSGVARAIEKFVQGMRQRPLHSRQGRRA